MKKRAIALLFCLFSVGANAAECGFFANLFGFCSVVVDATGPGQGDPAASTGPGQGDPG